MKEPGPSSPGTQAASDQLLRRLIELNPGFLWATDRDLRFLVVAGSGLLARGAKSPDEFVGKTLHELLEPGDIAIEMHGRALAGESVVYMSPRGETTWRGHVEPLRGPDGEIEGVVGIALEVSELVHAEEQLDASRAKLDLALAQLPAIFWATDDKLCLTSAAGRPIGDRPVETWIGKPLADLFGSPDHPAVLIHEEALRGSAGTYEIVNDGRDYDVRVEPLRSHEGEIVGTVGIAADVTERIQHRRTVEELATLVMHSSDAITGIGRDGRVFCWNPAAERMYGWLAEEMIGETTDRIIPVEERHEWEELRNRVWAGETVEQLAAIRLRKDGTPIRVWLIRTPILDEHGEVAGFSTIARDLSRREREDERRHTSQKLEAVSRLAGGIAQDFNNLLTAISGYADLAAKDVPAGPGREALESIQAATDRAVTLTQGLLAFGQRRLLHPTAVDLNQLLTDLQPLLERLVGRDVTIELVLAPDLPPVRFDPDALRQILFDLALNATEAMPAGGTISIETRSETESGLLRVTDTGVGMDAATRERAFDPFFSTKEAVTGSGLGLAAVHGTVLQSGGQLRLESSPGGGTRVELRLPLASSEEPQSIQVAAAGGRVLLVEDDELVRRLVVQTLEASGYVVSSPKTVSDALELVRSDAVFDLLLTDLVMPELYGDELVVQVRALRPGLPAIVMSGYVNDPEAFPDSVEFLSKPFRPGDLLATVARTIRRPDKPS
ncbi:MAG: two-component system, cell cycle sensor histidine kinase and response regulator CckA [Gaiellaceae bacterium]|nr:two-component system, cell cycle sensor histidine kinase and response regulator CckA [Gaiellaceae bacterium]